MMFSDEDWEYAVEEAKENLGYSPDEFVEDWDSVKEEALQILSDEGKDDHNEYLKSDRWKKLRKEVLVRDSHKCRRCNKEAQCVHHQTYNYKGGDFELEKNSCVSLCNNCHGIIHGRIRE